MVASAMRLPSTRLPPCDPIRASATVAASAVARSFGYWARRVGGVATIETDPLLTGSILALGQVSGPGQPWVAVDPQSGGRPRASWPTQAVSIPRRGS